jgi:membrane-anchored protein YejM (alkaline phosphatase superfamily)
VLEERRPPVLLDVLNEFGYDAQVFSAASMDYPEFRATAWVDMPERVHDHFGEPLPGRRDTPAVEACLDWWRTRDAKTPFFGFVLLDSSHQKYDFPAETAPFTPYAQDVDYLEMAGSRDPALIESVRNRYMNALHQADALVGRMLDELRASGQLDDTILILTGDHGEEFAEHGYWGHTGNFTLEQVAVPLLMRGPGIAPGLEHRPTSHLDIAPTLLEMLGADPAQRAQWCTSENLFAPSNTRARVVAGWEELGLWTASGIFRISRDPEKGFGAVVCDRDWQLAADQHTPFVVEAAALARLSSDCRRFLIAPDPGFALRAH